MSINCLEENNQNIAEIFKFFEKLPKEPIKVFANPRVCELYSMYAKDECNSYKCFGKKEALPDSATVSGKDVLLIDFGIIDGITAFRKVCMLYKMNARRVYTRCYFLSIGFSSIILKDSEKYKAVSAVSFEIFGDEEIEHYRNFIGRLSPGRYFSLESAFNFESDMYNTQNIINDKIRESAWTLKECAECNEQDSYYKISSSKLTSEQSEYLLSTGIIEYMDNNWFFLAESALAIISNFDSITESFFWLAMDVLYICNGIRTDEDIRFMKMYDPFINAYENEAIRHNFFGLDINKAEFDRLKEFYSHRTFLQIEAQIKFRRGLARKVSCHEDHPYHKAQKVAERIFIAM